LKNNLDSTPISLITLGCSKNSVDSEYLGSQLQNAGFKVVYDDLESDTYCAIINTCGFIHDAKEESVDMILKFAELKKKGKIKKLIVFGCLSQRYKDDLSGEIPEVDQFFGVGQLQAVCDFIDVPTHNVNPLSRHLSTPKHYAYMKIAEGCNKKCSFCAIPLIRGKHISRSIEDIVAESRRLADQGVKELILISQDLSYYGKDIYGHTRLEDLVLELAEIDNLQWIRLHYLYPKGFSMRLIETIKNNPKICNYIDIPFQHINNRILKSMRRGIDREEIVKLLDNIRNAIPEAAIRTSFIVGYPDESEKEFKELEQFIIDSEFDRMGIFSYSHEEDTSAYKLIDNVGGSLKDERKNNLMEIQRDISYRKNKMRTGNTVQAIIDRIEGEFYIGRTEFDSPEVDNELLIPMDGLSLTIGEIYSVKITNAEHYDLFGIVLPN